MGLEFAYRLGAVAPGLPIRRPAYRLAVGSTSGFIPLGDGFPRFMAEPEGFLRADDIRWAMGRPALGLVGVARSLHRAKVMPSDQFQHKRIKRYYVGGILIVYCINRAKYYYVEIVIS